MLGGGDSVSREFLAISQNDERAGLPLGFSKSLAGCGDCSRNIGSAFGYDRCIQFLKSVGDGIVVKCKRSLQKRRACKGDKADTITLEKPDQVLREKFRSREARGGDVRRQHAARSVNGHNDIAAFLLRLFFNETIARLSNSHDG